MEEIVKAINLFENRKAPGDDTILTELLKKKRNSPNYKIKIIVQKNTEGRGMEHVKNCARRIKKTNTTDYSYQVYRRISLLNTTLLSNVLLNREKLLASKIIENYQADFIQDKSTVDRIHTIKQIVKKSYEFDRDKYLLFLDFNQATKRSKLWWMI